MRYSATDPGTDRGDTAFLEHASFETFGRLQALFDRRALRQPKIDHDLRPTGVRKELLLYLPHSCQSEAKNQQGSANGLPAIFHTPVHKSAEAGIKRGIEKLMRIPVVGSMGAQQQRAQVGYEKDRNDPGNQQGGSGDGENREGVFAGHRLGHADRQESDRRDQRTGQHRHRSSVIGKGGRVHHVVALLQLSHHHLNRNNRVVNQQSQGNDQGAQRDLV